MLKSILCALEELIKTVNVGINVGINQSEILRLIQKNPKITALEIAQSLNITSRQVERLTAILKNKNIIRRTGAKKQVNGKF